MPSTTPTPKRRAHGSRGPSCARQFSVFPPDRSVLISGLLVAAYGVVLGAGYAIWPAGAAFVGAGAVIARAGSGGSDGLAAWFTRRRSNILALPTRIMDLAHAWRHRFVTVAVTVGLLLPVAAVNATASVIPRPGLGGATQAVLAPARISASGVSGFGGLTSQSMPVYLEASRDGRTIRRTVAALGFACRSGDRFVDLDGYRDLPVSAAGRFSASYHLPPERVGANEITDSGSIRGQFDRGRASVKGTWTETLLFRDTTTGQADTCSSAMRFSLRR